MQFRVWLAAAATLACSLAQAQSLENAYVFGEALQYSKQGTFRGCGLNIKLLQITELPSKDYIAVSLNFWLESPGAALIKTALSTASAGPPPSVKPKPIESSWVRLIEGTPLNQIKTMPGEDGALLFFTSMADAFELLEKLRDEDKTIQVGFKQPGQKFERVFFGKMAMEEQEKSSLATCFQEFAKNLPARK